MVSVAKFVCFAAVCIFNSGGILWWLGRVRSLEVACIRLLSWCLYFYMSWCLYFSCHGGGTFNVMVILLHVMVVVFSHAMVVVPFYMS